LKAYPKALAAAKPHGSAPPGRHPQPPNSTSTPYGRWLTSIARPLSALVSRNARGRVSTPN
jgi:hypothetical protein